MGTEMDVSDTSGSKIKVPKCGYRHFSSHFQTDSPPKMFHI